MDLALPWTHLADTLFKSFNVSICDDFRAVIFPCPGLHLPPSLPHSALPRCVIQYPSKMQGGLAEREGREGRTTKPAAWPSYPAAARRDWVTLRSE